LALVVVDVLVELDVVVDPDATGGALVLAEVVLLAAAVRHRPLSRGSRDARQRAGTGRIL
jgi:hypothetical protein